MPTTSPNFRAVLFDLDGTLLDTAPDFIVVLNRQLALHGQPPLPDDLIRNTVSNGARALVKLAFGFDDEHPQLHEFTEELKSLYQEHLSVFTQLFDGMPSLLDRFRETGIPWGIVTNKPSLYTLPLLADLKLDTQAAAVVCPDQVSQTKPHPEPMFKACQQMQVPPEQTLYVGDHIRDIQAGRNAGMKTVAAAYGYISPGDNPANWNADYLIHHPRELETVIWK